MKIGTAVGVTRTGALCPEKLHRSCQREKILQSRKRKYNEELRDEIGVFKRKTPNQVLKDLKSVSNEILDQERKLEEFKEKKKQLEASRNEPAMNFIADLSYVFYEF